MLADRQTDGLITNTTSIAPVLPERSNECSIFAVTFINIDWSDVGHRRDLVLVNAVAATVAV